MSLTDSDGDTQFLAVTVVYRCLNTKRAIFGEQTEMLFANDDFRTKAVFQHERTLAASERWQPLLWHPV